MGDLGGGHYDDPSLLHIGIGNRHLNVTVLDRLCPVLLLDHGQPFLTGRLLKTSVPQHKTGVRDHISRLFLMQKRCSLLHGCLRVQYHRVFLIFHFNLICRTSGCDIILRDHSCNVIPIHAYPPVQKLSVLNILMCLFH